MAEYGIVSKQVLTDIADATRNVTKKDVPIKVVDIASELNEATKKPEWFIIVDEPSKISNLAIDYDNFYRYSALKSGMNIYQFQLLVSGKNIEGYKTVAKACVDGYAWNDIPTTKEALYDDYLNNRKTFANLFNRTVQHYEDSDSSIGSGYYDCYRMAINMTLKDDAERTMAVLVMFMNDNDEVIYYNMLKTRFKAKDA